MEKNLYFIYKQNKDGSFGIGEKLKYEDINHIKLYNIGMSIILNNYPELKPENIIIFQIFFDIKNSIYIELKPAEIRINEQVRGKIEVLTDYEIKDIKAIHTGDLKFVEFKLLDSEKNKAHITVINLPDVSTNVEVKDNIIIFNKIVIWDLNFIKGASFYNELNIEKNWKKEQDFLSYLTVEGLSISPRNLYTYRNLCIFPEPVKLNRKVEKRYNPTWIKYIKKIKELMPLLKEKRITIESLRSLDEEFFKDIPRKNKKIRKIRK